MQSGWFANYLDYLNSSNIRHTLVKFDVNTIFNIRIVCISTINIMLFLPIYSCIGLYLVKSTFTIFVNLRWLFSLNNKTFLVVHKRDRKENFLRVLISTCSGMEIQEETIIGRLHVQKTDMWNVVYGRVVNKNIQPSEDSLGWDKGGNSSCDNNDKMKTLAKEKIKFFSYRVILLSLVVLLIDYLQLVLWMRTTMITHASNDWVEMKAYFEFTRVGRWYFKSVMVELRTMSST